MGNSGTFQPGPDSRRGRGPPPGGKRQAEKAVKKALAELAREERGWTVGSAKRLVDLTLEVFELVLESARKLLDAGDAKGAADILRAAPQADIPQMLAWMGSYSDGKPREKPPEDGEEEPVDAGELERKLGLVPPAATGGNAA